jgi:nucleotide-binding universal stress UspA family protein
MEGGAMTLLFALEEGDDCARALASARAIAEAAGWHVRILRVPGGAQGGLPKVPEKLARGAEVVDLGGEAADVEVLAAARADDVRVLSFCLAGQICDDEGKMAEHLLRDSTVSLLVGRAGVRKVAAVKRVLIPLEGSPSSSEAMRRAEEEFCARGRELIALHVVTSDVPLEPGSLPAPRMLDQEHYEWASWREEFTMRFSQCPQGGGRHRTIVRVGDPREVIQREASELGVDVIVAAWSQSFSAGHCARVRALLEGTPCPLLLVPAQTHLPI